MADDVIRDLAALHGRPDISDDEVKTVKKALTNAHIDGLLDAPQEKENDGEAKRS